MAARDNAGGGTGSARRRRERRLRSHLRHERMAIAMALAESLHHSTQRQETARAGGGAREELHGKAPDEAPPPQEPGTQYYGLDDNDSVPELSGGRLDPVLDPGPPVVGMRHSGVGYEVLLDFRVPQLGRDLTVLPDPEVHMWFESLEVLNEVTRRDIARSLQEILGQTTEHQEGQREEDDGGARSSNKMGKKGKRRKRRKKKLPKGSSSSPRRGVGDQGTKIVHAEDELTEVAEYSGGVETASCMAEMNKFIEEKVIGNREFIHKHGQPVTTMYSDRLHLYTVLRELLA